MREKFETYTIIHGWEIDHFYDPMREIGFLRASKKSMVVIREFKIGMDLLSMINEMKEHDYGPESVQGKFPFVESGELL